MFLEWNENLSVGVPSIDEQHKALLALLNELFDSTQAGRGQAVLGKVLKELADYTVYHFKYEGVPLCPDGLWRCARSHERT